MISYFVEKAILFKDLASIGLAHICEKPSAFVCRQIIGGPFNHNFAIGSTETIGEPRIGYFRDRQEIQNFGKFAIARDTEATFDPACLLKSTAIQSHPWQDWAGNTWQIPIARRWLDGSGQLVVQCALPRYLEMNESGQWVYGGVLPRHAKLWELATKFEEDILEAIQHAVDGKYTVPVPSLDDVCDIVFGTNYRVSKYELSFLKTLLDSSCYDVMKLVKDDPGFDQLQKKTV